MKLLIFCMVIQVSCFGKASSFTDSTASLAYQIGHGLIGNVLNFCPKLESRPCIQYCYSKYERRWYKDSDKSEFKSNYERLSCKISVPTMREPIKCKNERKESISQNRDFYALTLENNEHKTQFPLAGVFPFLNQSMDAVRFQSAFDEIDSRWGNILNMTKLRLKAEAKNSMKVMPAFDDTLHYKGAYHLHNHMIQKMKVSKYFSNPATESSFTSIIDNDRWMSDDIFVQQRLAGACPFLIKLVTEDGSVGMDWEDLKTKLSETYDFDGAVERATGIQGFTLNYGVSKSMVYVLYHEDKVQTKPDYFDSLKYGVKSPDLENITSPITLFVRTITGDLKVVAIQWDNKTDSEVFSPASNHIKWKLAKAMANLVDANYCQSVWHLSHVHFSSSVYCTIFKSHFSELHPMYQIMRYHCEGTVPHVNLAWPTLAAPNQEADKFFGMGREGFIKLAVNGKKQYRYGILAYDEVLKAHGLDSTKLKYHPFRDDGKVLWKEFQWFAKKFVDIFYRRNEDVMRDVELQSFANEVSADGNQPPFGGRGRITGFPSSFNNKQELRVFVTRFIWLVAMHGAVNYPIEPWYTFVPLTPQKLYRDERMHTKQNIAYAYPNGPSVLGGLGYASVLGNLRINRIMDHYNKIKHEKLSKLIGYHYNHLHSCVQKRLEARNAFRKERNFMGFQYFEPKWLTNSIHI